MHDDSREAADLTSSQEKPVASDGAVLGTVSVSGAGGGAGVCVQLGAPVWHSDCL